MTDREQLHRQGYVLLRRAIPAEWLADLRATFEAGVLPSNQWPVPRGMDWRHSLLDADSKVQAVCRLPQVLAVAGELIGERFFLSQVEGREPWPVAAISNCTATCRPNGQATSPTPWLFSTTTAPRTAPPASSPAAIVPGRESRHSTSPTSPGPCSSQAPPETSWCSMSIWCMPAA